jgi:hypothetical protein
MAYTGNGPYVGGKPGAAIANNMTARRNIIKRHCPCGGVREDLNMPDNACGLVLRLVLPGGRVGKLK